MSAQRGKSALVSVLTAGLEVGFLALCMTTLAGPILVAIRWLSGLCGAVLNFTLNRIWVFSGRRSGAAELFRFGATALCSITTSTAAWWALVSSTPYDPQVLHVTSMMAVWMVLTYPLLKRWVFAEAG